MNRRAFLGLAAVTGVATAVGGDATTPSAPPSPAQWARLAATLRGRLVRPGARTYPVDKLLYDPRFDALAPAAIAFCATPTDVARVIAFARTHGVELAVRAGGHSYAGYSSGTGRLVIDVTPMAGVVAAPRPGGVARVGAGARLVDVYNTLAHAGQLVPAGSCPTVGVGGLALGGGVGVFSRRYGLTSDQVTALTIVTADGAVRRVSPANDPALYWACRGGGGGNFGVVTQLELATHAIPTITLFTYEYPWGAAHDVLGAWQRWTEALDPAVWSNCQLLTGAGTRTVRVAGVACAPVSQTAAWLAPLLRQARPLGPGFLGGDAYLRTMMVEAGCAALTVAACHLDTHPPGALSRDPFEASSSYVARPMGDARLSAVVSVVDALASELPALGGGLVFDALGGAVNAVAPAATAFVHRSFLASIQSSFTWSSSTPSTEIQGGRRWLARVRSAVYDATTGAYQNYIDPTLPSWPRAYYGENLPRLSRVKASYDPDGVFRFAQSIPPAP